MENRIFRPIMRLIVVVLLCAFWPSIARAFDTIACDEPNGFRYNYENTGEITEERETAKGSYPTFKIDPQDSGKLLVYWADSKLAPIFPGYNTGEEPSRAIVKLPLQSLLYSHSRKLCGCIRSFLIVELASIPGSKPFLIRGYQPQCCILNVSSPLSRRTRRDKETQIPSQVKYVITSREGCREAAGWVLPFCTVYTRSPIQNRLDWLRMIRDHIITSFHLDRDDLDMALFDGKGGMGQMYEFFGERTDDVIDELNEALAA